MARVTGIMIREFKILELGYDFMGYSLNKEKSEIYSYHHLIIPSRNGGPASFKNGAVLCSLSSHPYLHTIEEIDYDIFCYLTSEMIDMHAKRCIDMENLQRINDLLCQFERENCSKRSKNGQPLIKEQYVKRFLNR